MAAFLAFTGVRQRMLGEGMRLLEAASQYLRFPQGETTECLEGYSARLNALLQRRHEQRNSVGDTPAQGIRCPQCCSNRGEYRRAVHSLPAAHGPFERGECPG